MPENTVDTDLTEEAVNGQSDISFDEFIGAATDAMSEAIGLSEAGDSQALQRVLRDVAVIYAETYTENDAEMFAAEIVNNVDFSTINRNEIREWLIAHLQVPSDLTDTFEEEDNIEAAETVADMVNDAVKSQTEPIMQALQALTEKLERVESVLSVNGGKKHAKKNTVSMRSRLHLLNSSRDDDTKGIDDNVAKRMLERGPQSGGK